MKKISLFLSGVALASAAMVGCNEDTTVGSTLVQDKITVVVDSDFVVTGVSVPMHKVQSRTTAQLLGRIDADGFGRLSSDVVTQFMPSSSIDTTYVTAADIDSLMLYMYMADGEFVGDSVIPMGINIYRLNKPLPSPIYSNFDPTGYYNPSDKLASGIYNVSKLSADSVFDGAVEIKVQLPLSLGQELFNAYRANSDNFTTPTAFAQNVFQGIYIENSFGSGRLINTSTTMMTLFYHKTYYDESLEADTTVYSDGNYFAVTPEIITNNDIKLEVSDKLTSRINNGQTLLVAPVGYGVQMRFPAPEIIASYKQHQEGLQVLNNLTFSIPASVIDNEYDFTVPQYVLLVLSKDEDDFFAKNQLPDNVTSFYAAYDEDNQCYTFGDMRSYLADLLKKESIDESDYTFSILPVSCTFESSTSSYYYSTTTTLSLVNPYVASPVLARLMLDKAKIKLTFSTQTVAN